MSKDIQLRLGIYIAIALLTPLISNLAELTPAIMATMLWPQWLVLVLNPILACLITVRAYLDQSVSREQKEAVK